MINGNNSRLDRIESDLETVTSIVVTLARHAEETEERIDRLVESQDRTQRQLDQLSVTTDAAIQRIDQTLSSLAATQLSISAALERQDRILDYLMRRDRNGDSS